MQARQAMAVAAAALLAACGGPERAPPPYFEIPPGPVGSKSDGAPPEDAAASPNGRLVLPPNPSVQYFLPSNSGDVGRGPTPVARPDAATTPFYAAPPNLGPVTGYGPGGMAQPPGAPPNPPYSR